MTTHEELMMLREATEDYEDMLNQIKSVREDKDLFEQDPLRLKYLQAIRDLAVEIREASWASWAKPARKVNHEKN